MARNVYVTTALHGGGSALDGVDGAGIVKGDLAFFINKHTTANANTQGFYGGVYMASSRGSTIAFGSTEEAAADGKGNWVVPDANGANLIWGLTPSLVPVFHTTGKTAPITNYGITVIRTTAPTVHVMRRPRRGIYKKLVFATTNIIKIRLTTAVGAYTVKLGQAKKVGSSCCVIISSSRNRGWGGVLKFPNIIELAGRTTGYWEIISSPTTNKAFTFSSAT